MGRRIISLLGVSLIAAALSASARAQDDDKPPPPIEAPPAVATAPVQELPPPAALPDDVAAPTDRKDADPKPADESQRPEQKPKAQPKSSAKVKSKSGAGATLLHANDDPGASAIPPLRDEHVLKVQAPAGDKDRPAPPAPVPAHAAPPARAAGDPEAGLPAVARLPLGKQSVAVTVDVQAPTSMNLKQDATLKLIVRNTGTSDAFNLRINDELPDGLDYVSSLPEMTLIDGSHLLYQVSNLPAGSERVITIKVKPTKTGSYDHAATVTFETGCKSRTRVLQPKLKVDVLVNPTVGKVLKGQPVEFKVAVTNNGDAPARHVSIQAKLSPGLRHDDSADKGEYETNLPELAPGQTETLDALVADALAEGQQSCTVTAQSPDVVFTKEDAECAKTINVVAPQLKLTLDGPAERYTDTVADYKITLDNPGTASARKVRILATLPVSGRLVKTPPEGRYDSTTRRLSWALDLLEPGKPVVLPFQVRVGGVGQYDMIVEAVAEGTLKAKDRKNTDVKGIADVDLVVSESKRVLDVGGTTLFQIRLHNYGTKEATNIVVEANLASNLKFERAGGGSQDVKVDKNVQTNSIRFSNIEKLGSGKELLLGVEVSVAGDTPKLATCRVTMTHDELNDKLEDMAAVKVTNQRRAAAADGDGRQR
jgi:uncharacterized repeat protein (TIGR01451 family)